MYAGLYSISNPAQFVPFVWHGDGLTLSCSDLQA